MDKFPNEILTKIFQPLSHSEILRCASVCKKWYHVIRQQQFFGMIGLSYDEKKWAIWQDVYGKAPIFPFSCISASGKYYNYKLADVKNIRHLEVVLDPSELKKQIEWINKLNNVERLDIMAHDEAIDLSDFEAKDSVKILQTENWKLCENLIPKLAKLREIHFRTDKVDIERIEKIAAKVPNLHLSFGLSTFEPPEIQALISAAKPNITIKDVRINLDMNRIAMAKKLAQSYSNLQRLWLSVCDCLTSKTLIQIAKFLPNMKELTIEEINKWPIKYVLDDLAPCERLRDLNLSFNKLPRLKFVKKVSSFPNIRSLDIRCDETSLTIDDVAFTLAMKSCPMIVALDLDIETTNAHVQAITENLKGLKNLVLFKASALPTLRKLHHLEKLTIDFGLNLTNATLLNEFKLRTLTSLTLQECALLTDIGIEAVTRECPFIEHLVIGAARLTDASIEAICQNLKYLKRLYINKGFTAGFNFTSKSVQMLKQMSEERGFPGNVQFDNDSLSYDRI